MKLSLLFFFFIPFIALTQDCKLKKSTDPFSHETRISTGFIKFISGQLDLSISVDAGPSDIDIFIWLNGESYCFDDASTAQVIYDGERLKSNFKNNGTMNCQGAFHLNFRNLNETVSSLNRLQTKKLKTIHLAGANKTVVDINFTDEQKQVFMDMINCVVKEAKSLIKQ